MTLGQDDKLCECGSGVVKCGKRLYKDQYHSTQSLAEMLGFKLWMTTKDQKTIKHTKIMA